jgi:hypothetical protein
MSFGFFVIGIITNVVMGFLKNVLLPFDTISTLYVNMG